LKIIEQSGRSKNENVAIASTFVNGKQQISNEKIYFIKFNINCKFFFIDLKIQPLKLM